MDILKTGDLFMPRIFENCDIEENLKSIIKKILRARKSKKLKKTSSIIIHNMIF